MSAPKEKNFGKSEPQPSNVYKYKPPPELLSIDDPESRGDRKNPKPLEITDPAFDSDFVPTREPERVYYKRGKK
jgi:hypothetical protein